MATAQEKSAELVARLERLPFSKWHRNFFVLAFCRIMFDAADAKEQDVRNLSGQTDRIIAKDQAYLTEVAIAVRGRLARRAAREAERVAN